MQNSPRQCTPRQAHAAAIGYLYLTLGDFKISIVNALLGSQEPRGGTGGASEPALSLMMAPGAVGGRCL